MTAEHIQYIPEIVIPEMRLGRHIHLEANRMAVPHAGPAQAVTSKTWARDIPILNQGNVGSCTGNAMDGALGTTPVFQTLPSNHPALDENEALNLYSAAEVIDGDGPYPPNDNGSTGPSVAQAAQNAGLIKGYNHYKDLNSTLQSLMNGPVIIGMNWYSSFDTPAADGTVAITADAYVRGGHEVLARVVDVTNQMIGFDNSWGTSWGVNGSFKMSYATLTQLLSEGGDCTSFIPLAAPSPTPNPPKPKPKPNKPSWFDEFIKWIESFFA